MTDKYEVEYPSEITTEYLYRELRRISKTLNDLIDGQTQIRYAEPEKPRDGQKVYADGTQWNPGIGRGFYWYRASDGAWVPYG